MTVQSITSDQEKQFRRFVEDMYHHALKEVNPDKEGLQRLFARGGEFHVQGVATIRRLTAKTPDYDLARTILGKDFISPEEIAKSRKIVYTDEQFAAFGDTLPAQDVLEWFRDNGFMLVAGPPKEMSLLDIRALHAPYFYSKEGGWYANEKETFARNDKATTAWIALRKEPVPDSLNKNWDEQQALLSEFEVVPNAAATTWAVTTYKAVMGFYLLKNVYVRTSSRDSDGVRVVVGRFDDTGLDVGSYWGDDRVSSLGIVSVRESRTLNP